MAVPELHARARGTHLTKGSSIENTAPYPDDLSFYLETTA